MESTQLNIQTIKQLFEKSADILFQEFSFQQSNVLIIKCESMVDENLLYNLVLPSIEKLFTESKENVTVSMINQLPIPELKKVTSKDELITQVYTGHVLIYFSEFNLLYSCGIANIPNRKTEDTKIEAIIKGPRDNFIESLSTNIALIRKRLPTNSLCIEKMTVGRRTKTNIAILYIDDIANKNILTELKTQISKIDTDVILGADALMEFVNKKKWLIPVSNYTGKPDFTVQSLIRGRFAILVDGSPYSIITPTNLLFLIKSSEDDETLTVYSSFERLMRLLGIFIGVTFPAFYLAITSFHQNQLPMQLLATIVVSNRGLPFPRIIEMLVLIVMFEMFREAGVRLPTVLGGTLSVVGGLIIGDAAIRAGITSPAMLVVISITTIATNTIVNQSLVTIISILRILFILVTSFFGLFGFYMCIFTLILYLANLRVFGVPYLNISADLSLSTFTKSIFRLSKTNYKDRPKTLDPQDQTRS